MIRHALHVAVNLFQHQSVDREAASLRKEKQAQEDFRIIQDLGEFLRRHRHRSI